jgi:hypothetical protein
MLEKPFDHIGMLESIRTVWKIFNHNYHCVLTFVR